MSFPSHLPRNFANPPTGLWKSGQGRERRVKSSPDLNNLCSILIKISLPLPHHPPSSTPPLRHVSLCYELASCLGHRGAPENPPGAPPWAHVANTSIPCSLLQGWTQSLSVLATTAASSSPLQLPASRPDPSFPVKSKPQYLALSGPQPGRRMGSSRRCEDPHSGLLS